MGRAKIIAGQALCGAVGGLFVAAILAAVAAPRFSELALPLAQAAEFARIARLGELAQKLCAAGIVVLPLAALVFWLLVARDLNAGLPGFPFTRAPKPLLAWLASVLSGAALLGALWGAINSISFDPGGADSGGLFYPAFWAACGGAACWLILSPAGLAGDLSAWRWRLELRPALRAAALGGTCGALLALGAAAIGRLFDFLFKLNIEVWRPGANVRLDADLVNIALVVGIGALCVPAAGSLCRTLADDCAPPPERLRRAVPAFAALLLAGVPALALHADAVAHHDWRAPGIAALALLPDAAAPGKTVVAFGFGPKSPILDVKAWPLAADFGSFTVSAHAAATRANAEALERFAAGPGRQSRFGSAAAAGAVTIYAVLWEPEQASAVIGRLGGGDGRYVSLLDAMIERARLSLAAAITPENRARLEVLSDPGRYQIPGRYAAKLSKAWLRFGDLDRAAWWLDRAGALGVLESDIKGYSIPAKAPRTDCAVSGRLLIDGRPAEGARVGLFEVDADTRYSSTPYRGKGALTRLAAAQTLARGGAFSFTRLSEGGYVLAALVDAGAVPPKAKLVRATANPGRITLSRERPRAEVSAAVSTTGH